MVNSQVLNPKYLKNITELENITFSYENLNWAMNKVKRRYYSDFVDKFPVGHDKERLEDFLKERDKNLSTIGKELKSGKYKLSPFLERKVPKSHKKALILCQGCLRDVVVQVAVNRVLTDYLQSYFSKGLYSGRRRGFSVNIHKLLKQVYDFHKEGKYYALKLDIEDYFNQINRKVLIDQIQGLFGKGSAFTKVLNSYIYSPRVMKGKVVRRTKGIPIGSHLASLLANLYLTSFDKLMESKTKFYARYADDVFVIDTNRSKIDTVLKFIRKELAKYSLKINEEKLKVVRPGESFEYLGFEFRDGNIYIRSKSIRKFGNKIRSCIRRKRYVKLNKVLNVTKLDKERTLLLAELVFEINKLVCGTQLKSWVRYFAKVSFADQFRKLDMWIMDKLRQKLTGRWGEKSYRKFSNSFFREMGLKSLVREYYGWRERWRDFSKPLINKIASLSNLEKSLSYYLTRRNLEKNKEVQRFLINKKENLEKIHEQLIRGSYEFHRPKRKIIKRFDTKEKRFIFTSCLEDRIVQRAVMNFVCAYFNDVISENVYSYRKGSSVLKATSQVIRLLRSIENKIVFKSDFENFHENVDLEILRSQLNRLLKDSPKVLCIFENFLDSLDSVGFLPKGMPFTNFLLNIYLVDFDDAVSQKFDSYIRYADDFIVIFRPRVGIGEIRSFITKEAERLKLVLKEQKSKVVEKGSFEFLGYRFNLRNALGIGLSDFTVRRLKRKIRRLTNKRKFAGVNLANYRKGNETQDLISRFNYLFSTKKRSSWSKYYCRVNDFDQIREIDRWLKDRIRLCITNRMRLRNRRRIPSQELADMGLVSIPTWLYRAKKLMYNRSALNQIKD